MIGLASLGIPDEWITKLATVRCSILRSIQSPCISTVLVHHVNKSALCGQSLVDVVSLGNKKPTFCPSPQLYWFTVEFGMVDEGGIPKAYGAGILSAPQELNQCITDVPQHKDLDIETAIATSYPETGIQPIYFVAKSMESMTRQLM